MMMVLLSIIKHKRLMSMMALPIPLLALPQAMFAFQIVSRLAICNDLSNTPRRAAGCGRFTTSHDWMC